MRVKCEIIEYKPWHRNPLMRALRWQSIEWLKAAPVLLYAPEADFVLGMLGYDRKKKKYVLRRDKPCVYGEGEDITGIFARIEENWAKRKTKVVEIDRDELEGFKELGRMYEKAREKINSTSDDLEKAVNELNIQL